MPPAAVARCWFLSRNCWMKRPNQLAVLGSDYPLPSYFPWDLIPKHKRICTGFLVFQICYFDATRPPLVCHPSPSWSSTKEGPKSSLMCHSLPPLCSVWRWRQRSTSAFRAKSPRLFFGSFLFTKFVIAARVKRTLKLRKLQVAPVVAAGQPHALFQTVKVLQQVNGAVQLSSYKIQIWSKHGNYFLNTSVSSAIVENFLKQHMRDICNDQTSGKLLFTRSIDHPPPMRREFLFVTLRGTQNLQLLLYTCWQHIYRRKAYKTKAVFMLQPCTPPGFLDNFAERHRTRRTTPVMIPFDRILGNFSGDKDILDGMHKFRNIESFQSFPPQRNERQLLRSYQDRRGPTPVILALLSLVGIVRLTMRAIYITWCLRVAGWLRVVWRTLQEPCKCACNNHN